MKNYFIKEQDITTVSPQEIIRNFNLAIDKKDLSLASKLLKQYLREELLWGDVQIS